MDSRDCISAVTYSCQWKGLRSQTAIQDKPLAAWGGDPVESVSQVMLVSMVTGCAEVIIGALGTFPANPNDWLLTTGVTHGSVMFDT